MKKLGIALLIMALLISVFVACADNTDAETTDGTNETTVEMTDDVTTVDDDDKKPDDDKDTDDGGDGETRDPIRDGLSTGDFDPDGEADYDNFGGNY